MSVLRLDEDARAFRRAAGPLAWFVLEELALADGTRDGGVLVVPASVRGLGAAVSLNKDTVARSLGVLVELGVVEQRQSMTGGRFEAGRYAVTLPSGLTVLDDTTAAPLRRPRAHARTHADAHERPHEPTQLTLLDIADTATPRTSVRADPAPPQPEDALAPSVRGRRGTRPRDENGMAGRSVRPC